MLEEMSPSKMVPFQWTFVKFQRDNYSCNSELTDPTNYSYSLPSATNTSIYTMQWKKNNIDYSVKN